MRAAIVLFNLGGPDCLANVRPFLENLFSDKAIISLPWFLRMPLAAFIAARREKEARKIYQSIGGASPLLANTKKQADALQEKLRSSGMEASCFIAMRYWHPMSREAASQVKQFGPSHIVYLPLYPQFSATTTGSSLKAFDAALRKMRVAAKAAKICCYPTLPGFIAAQTQLIKPLYEQASREAKLYGTKNPPRILFSAHGLPARVIAAGDPYQFQCEQTAKALVAALGIPNLDWKNTYQSRVGPLEWIRPYTDYEIRQAGHDGVPLVVAPIAFVSEHSETLYELDQQYRDLAKECHVPLYLRAPAVSTHPLFIEGLAELVKEALARDATGPLPDSGARICPAEFTQCVCKNL